MSTPREIHLIPDCGLRIEIDKSKFQGLDYTNSSMPWRYKVTNCDQICSRSRTTVAFQESYEGWLSPTARITLPPKIKREAGIPADATSYAFLYPPQGLLEVLPQQNRQNSQDSLESFFDPEPSQSTIDQRGIECAATLGGFAYFDNNCECISINALSLNRSERTLKFSGPFKVKQCVCDELCILHRVHPLQLDIFHEVGFVSYAWVRPMEMLQFECVFDTEGPEGPQNSNGTMVFFREDGAGVAYAVAKSDYIDPTGYVGILSEPVLKLGEAKFTDRVIQPISEIDAWRARVKHWTKSMGITKLLNTVEDKRRVIHMACHAGLGHEFISDVLSNVQEKQDLSYHDDFGWNPLHYACRFSPRDITLIKLLVAKCPEAVVQHDFYDRFPLHIACNSDASEEVIAVLLKSDTCNPKVTVNKKTRKFGFLPLHLACFNGAKEGIINALLNADDDNTTAIQKSKGGHLPLHLAILKKLPASMVKAFLDVDSKLTKSAKSNFDSSTVNFDADIRQSLDGKLPLHLACYNNSTSEIIQLLLEKDEQNMTINENVNTAAHGDLGDVQLRSMPSIRYLGEKQKLTQKRDISNLTSQTTSSGNEQSNGVVALHLAMRHGSKAVISLLLRKEREKMNDKNKVSMLHKRDVLGRTPLHIACQYNVSCRIIQYLLDLDPFKKTTQIRDLQGYMPMHYACENKDTSVETINILLDAEEQYIEESRKKCVIRRRSTHTGDLERKRTPLYFAVRSRVDAKVIAKLLQPKNLNLKDFDDPAMEDLAEVVKNNSDVQAEVIKTLSGRAYFLQLILDGYTCIIALIFFFKGSMKYFSDEITMIEPSILLVSAAVSTLRELLQFRSIGLDYIGDLWNLFEIVNIILLVASSSFMLEEAGNPSSNDQRSVQKYLLITTGLFVLIQMILYLRTTLLPFARFFGGLLLIVEKLIPFLVVMLLMLVFFVHAWWVKECINCPETCPLWDFVFITFGLIFEFEPETLGLLEASFAVLIIIVLFNILIAIVGEAWTSATEKSAGLFWKYRLEKIKELRYATEYHHPLIRHFPTFAFYYNIVMEKIDSLKDISYGNDISWTKSPYHVLTDKDHYDNPQNYFDSAQVKIISDAHSLQADIYWAEVDGDLMFCGKFMLIFRWLGLCICYGTVVILGFPTLGILWPKKFRASLLTWDDSRDKTSCQYAPK